MSTAKTISFRRNLPKKKVVSQAVTTDYGFIKIWIWTYFLLLLFEGALRKWFLPELSQGLLIIRDPLVIWIYYLCYAQGVFPLNNKYLQKCFQWVMLAVILSFLVNRTHPFTIAYGARTNLLHFPLIFIMARVLSWRDVINYGKAFLLLALPMTWVVAQQFQADRFDTINTAAGGVGHQMMTSGDKVRASGTFSFVSGIVFYYCFAIAFITYGFLVKSTFPKWMLYLGTSATLLAMVTAGSRAVIAECLQVLACVGFLAYFKPNEFGKIAGSILGFSTLGLILYTQVDLFQEGLDFLTLRFEEAANIEGNPIEAYFNRYYQLIVAPYYYNMWTDWLGTSGLGGATRAGAAIGGGWGGAENSWARPIIENGIIIGGLFIFWRLWITKDLLVACIEGVKRGNYLAIFLFGAAGPILLFGLLGQPTNLGFAAFGSGLCLTAAVSQKEPS
tara:strand:+ start:656 stop:1993 length:1338 start_codon:yes stop_codon:yes gene_type:complete